MNDFDLLDAKSSFFFYLGRIAKVKEAREYGKVGDYYSSIIVGGVPVEKATVEAFVAGEPAFVVKGALLDKFVEIAGPVVTEVYADRRGRSYRFAALGSRSIELISDRVGFECSAETYGLPDELLDQRERLVTALNEAVKAMKNYLS